MTETKNKTKKGHGKQIAIAITVVMGALVAALAGYTFLYSGIHHGITAGEMPIGGMKRNEAERFIDESGKSLFSDGTAVQLSVNGKTYPVVIGEVATGMDSAKTVDEAYRYTHEGNPFTRMGHVISALIGKHGVPLEIAVHEKNLAARLEEISNEALTAPVDPTWKLEGDNLVIDRGMPGVDFNRNAVASEVSKRIAVMDFKPYEVESIVEPQASVNLEQVKADVDKTAQNATVSKEDGKTIVPSVDGVEMDLALAQTQLNAAGGATSISIPIKRTPATVTAEMLSKVLFRDTLATAKTNFSSSNSSRSNNVRLASSFINGTILNPGDEFSYNNVVGERTSARGFKAAGAYVAGKLVDEVGGGVCQPSSTLYMAVLRADLEVTVRQNHGMTVSYTPLGEDATVSYGSIDFKFRNNTGYPVKIITDSSGGTLTMTLVGTKTSDKTVKTDREIVATYTPSTIEKQDATLAAGKTTVEQNPTTGYKVYTYKIITENGKTTRVKANTSTYKKKDKIVLVGTKSSTASTPPAEESKPTSGTESAKPSTEKPSTDKPSAEKPSTEKPSTEKPSTEKPTTEKPPAETTPPEATPPENPPAQDTPDPE